MNTIGLIVGIVFGILVADRFGVELSISANISMGALQLPVILLNLRLLPGNAEEVEPVDVVGNGGGRVYNWSDARDVAGSHETCALVDPNGLLSHSPV